MIGYAVAVTILLIVFAIAAHSLRQTTNAQRAEIRAARKEREQLVTDLAAAQAERDAARSMRDQWKESSAGWRKEALAQLEYNRRLLAKMENRVLPDDDEDLTEPPTVSEADRRALEVQRTRTPVAVADRDVPPIVRAERGDDEDEDEDEG